MARAGLTTARVVEAGLDLADEAGLAAVTVSALARRLDVRVPSLYAHVGGSDDLAQRLCARALDDLADRCATAIAGRAGGEALRALADTHRAYATAHPGRWQALRATSADPAPAVLAAGRRHAEQSRAVLRGYDLAEPATTHAVRLLGGVVAGWVDTERAGGFAHSEPDAEESWAWALERLDVALRG